MVDGFCYLVIIVFKSLSRLVVEYISRVSEAFGIKETRQAPLRFYFCSLEMYNFYHFF